MRPSDKGNEIHDRFTNTELRKKEKLMRQFLSDGPKGTTDAYRDGWERIFGHDSRRLGKNLWP